MGFCNRKGVECECLTDYSNCNSDNCHRKLPDAKYKLEDVQIPTTPAIGNLSPKYYTNGLVLNWGDSSCILIMNNFNIIDMRNLDFSKFDSIELNGNRFVKESIREAE